MTAISAAALYTGVNILFLFFLITLIILHRLFQLLKQCYFLQNHWN